MSKKKTGFLEQFTGVLYKPRAIFNEIDEGDLVKGLIVMLLMVVLAAYSNMLYMSKIPLSVFTSLIEGVDVSQFEGTMGVMAGVGAGVTILFGWIAGTLLMHGLSRLSGGDGSMRRFFAMHGFAATPHVVNYMVRLADSFISSPSQLAGYFVANRDIENSVLKAVIGTNLFTVFGLAALIYITYALEENYQIGRKKAFIVALVPYAMYVVVNLFSPAG